MIEVTRTALRNSAVLTLSNEGKLNALTSSMLDQLKKHLSEIESDDTVRAIIITGAGEKIFCCGADIAEWGSLKPEEFANFWVRNGHRVFDHLARVRQPTIGVINGHAFGGGLELAACCDIRIMSDQATLALPEAKVGMVPGWSGTQRLARLLPETVVKEMTLFGRRIPAQRARELGFVVEVADDPMRRAEEIVESLSEASPRANELAKAMIHGAVGEDQAATIEMLGSAAASTSVDRAEGVLAFLEKRSPKFSGR